MAKKKKDDWTGILFVVAVVVAVLLGVLGTIDETVAALLAILGILLGFLAAKLKDTKEFATYGLMLVIVCYLAYGAAKVPAIDQIFRALLLTFAPAVAVVTVNDMMEMVRG